MWINVEDKLPNTKENGESEDFLILLDDGKMYVGYLKFYGITNYREKEEYFWHERSTGCGCCSSDLDATHWMPLPQPPMGDHIIFNEDILETMDKKIHGEVNELEKR
jgi:hypothetical protein